MSRLRAATALALLAVAGVAAIGCGDDADPDQQEITTVLDKLREAQDAGDAEAACREIYVIREPERPSEEGSEGAEGEAESESEAASEPESEAEAEGEGEEGEEGLGECEDAFKKAVALRRAEVTELSTSVGSIEVDGDSATAIVHTELKRADGSELTQDVPYDFVRTEDGWRIRIADEG